MLLVVLWTLRLSLFLVVIVLYDLSQRVYLVDGMAIAHVPE
jgi:hypothetical protein